MSYRQVDIEISEQHAREIDRLVSTVRISIQLLPVDARLVLAMQLIELVKPESDEMKRRAEV